MADFQTFAEVDMSGRYDTKSADRRSRKIKEILIGNRQRTIKQLYCRVLTPTKDPKAINHGGVGVCAHQTVWVEKAFMAKHHPGKVLQVHLMDNP